MLVDCGTVWPIELLRISERERERELPLYLEKVRIKKKLF